MARPAFATEKTVSKPEMDLGYVENRGFLLDLRILALTLVRVLRGEGVNRPGEATVEKFRGDRQ